MTSRGSNQSGSGSGPNRSGSAPGESDDLFDIDDFGADVDEERTTMDRSLLAQLQAERATAPPSLLDEDQDHLEMATVVPEIVRNTTTPPSPVVPRVEGASADDSSFAATDDGPTTLGFSPFHSAGSQGSVVVSGEGDGAVPTSPRAVRTARVVAAADAPFEALMSGGTRPAREPVTSSAPRAPTEPAPVEATVADVRGVDLLEQIRNTVEDDELFPPTRPSQGRLETEIAADKPVQLGLQNARAGSVRGGERFGKYVLLGSVGDGGMAEVRLACELRSSGGPQPCVIKRINDDLAYEPDVREMFLEEGRICALLEHPNIVRFYEYDKVGDVAYIAMELVDGVDLATLDVMTGASGLPLSAILETVEIVARALHHAHETRGPDGQLLNVIHRDISPQNILISRDGDVKLADFGIARFDGRGHKTAIGPPKGKLRYLSPEQMQYRPIDRRVDVFALGVVLVEMLSRQVLMPKGVLHIDDLAMLVRQRCVATTHPIGPQLMSMIQSMTSPEAAERPETALHVADELGLARSALHDRTHIADIARSAIPQHLPPALETMQAMLQGAAPQGSGGARRVPTSAMANAFASHSFPTAAHLLAAQQDGVNWSPDESYGESGLADTHLPGSLPSASMVQLAAEQRHGVPATKQLPHVPDPRGASGEAYGARGASHATPTTPGNKTRTWLIILLLIGALILGVLTALVIRQSLLS